MPRINVLTGETPPPTIEAAPKSRKKKAAPKSKSAAPPAPTLAATIGGLADSVFAFLSGNPECDVKPLRAAFVEYAANHPGHTDWRKAWEPFWKLNGPKFGKQPEPEPGAEKAPLVFNPRLEPLLTRAFPKAIRRVLGAHGDLPAFETAIAGRGDFHCRYELDGYQPLIIEILPPSMCPAGVPAVSVSHTFLQNGDVMRDPEIVFALFQHTGWLAYEITQDPVGIYRCAYGRDEHAGAVFPRVVKDINSLVSLWAGNLIAHGWSKPPPKPPSEIGPNVGAMVESALADSGKVVPFASPTTRAGLDPAVAAILAEINGATLCGRSSTPITRCLK